jgi:hypothetical protein
MVNSSTKLKAAVAANTCTAKKDEGVHTRCKTFLSRGTYHRTFFIIIRFCSLPDPTSIRLKQPLLNSYSEKMNYFIIFDEIGQLAAGMIYIPTI